VSCHHGHPQQHGLTDGAQGTSSRECGGGATWASVPALMSALWQGQHRWPKNAQQWILAAVES
jgi:hypothetical protein